MLVHQNKDSKLRSIILKQLRKNKQLMDKEDDIKLAKFLHLNHKITKGHKYRYSAQDDNKNYLELPNNLNNHTNNEEVGQSLFQNDKKNRSISNSLKREFIKDQLSCESQRVQFTNRAYQERNVSLKY